MTGRARLAVLLALLLALAPACGSTRVASAGRRLGTDAWVTLTSPVQVPAMSFRDAVEWSPERDVGILLFPIVFPIYLVEHVAFTAVHAVDLLLAPVHLFNEWEPLAIYDTEPFPMRARPDAIESLEAGFATTVLIFGGVIVALLID